MKATFGAGCFWHVEEVLAGVPGVTSTRVGYTGGRLPDPTYEEVCTDGTGHAEAVEVEFDPERVSYRRLLEVFWESHDPTTPNRQGPDVGTQYRSAIFYHGDVQRREAEASKESRSAAHSDPIVTEIVPAPVFYEAEGYHQRYLKKRGLA